MNWDYLAGFLDGEGSIIIKPPRIRLYISNTNKGVLDEIAKFVKCGRIYEINRKLEKWKRQYGWTIANHKDCLRILEGLNGKLIVKNDLCIKAIEYIKNKRWHGEYISKEELKRYNGIPYRKVAKLIGVSHCSIFKYRKKFGLK
jgi:intein/homing endonuclease